MWIRRGIFICRRIVTGNAVFVYFIFFTVAADGRYMKREQTSAAQTATAAAGSGRARARSIGETVADPHLA